MGFNVPILLLSFNRPLLVTKQLKLLKEINPKSLYIFSDGPRNDVLSDYSKVNACRKIFQEEISWECEKQF